ncbi:ATP-binding protein [Natronolimnohabitans innermongolicus]|uniref:histidine kinase n=1 Tax=Natronolimnohabitans innermongolicus JCM 12255 TaxID=1227499 RepID=L9XD03_9EURY|nr:ATP-binding protein [Natronolimnohabitans innermongolicus]ELY59630.1 multi-sensor signal transduction histidine kinase [Natronolimnohabitans innermongolicus JCM 12255]
MLTESDRTASLANRSGSGSRVLLLIEHDENRRLLAKWLSTHHEVVQEHPEDALDETIDLCLIDQRSLQRHKDLLVERKDALQPLFLPYLLVVTQQNSRQVSADLWKRIDAVIDDGIDDLITSPIQKTELKGRIENLLRTREQSLRLTEQKEELQQLNHVNTVIRNITRALVQASTRAEIEQTVCDRLVESEPYRFAWIGEPDAETETIEPLASAGENGITLEGATITFGDGDDDGPEGRAIRTRTMQVGQNLSESPATDWQDRLVDAGLQSIASIPLVYDETLYGTLNVYAERENAFDADERDLLEELGSTIPYAMQTVIAKERYRSFVEDIFGQSEIGVRILDATETVTWINDAFEQYFGVDRCELVGRDNESVVGDELVAIVDDSEAFADRVTGPYSSETDVESFECRIEPDDAREERYLHHRSQPITSGRYAGGRIELYYDITKRKEAEAELEETIGKLERSNNELEQFAYVASHDLREPLRMVSSYLQLLEQRYDDELDQDAQEFIDFAVDGAERMTEMIEDLLEYSRVNTRGKEFEPTDCEAVLEETLENLHLQIDETDAEVTADSLPTVTGDDTQLLQLFQNLISNAIEYAGDEPPRIHVDARRQGERWLFSIEDNGVGIDAEQTDEIFEIFSQAGEQGHDSGTGIGLAVCQKIVTRHGGEIWVESKSGEGSTFFFTIPDDTQS